MNDDALSQSRTRSLKPEGMSFDPGDPDVIHGTKISALIVLLAPLACVLVYCLFYYDRPQLQWWHIVLLVYGVYMAGCYPLRRLGVKALFLPDLFHECSHWAGVKLLKLEEKSLRLILFPPSPSERYPRRLGNPHLSIGEPVSFRHFTVVALFPVFTLLATTFFLVLIFPSDSLLWWWFLSTLLPGSANDLSWVIKVIERKGTKKLMVDHGDHLKLQ